MKARAFWVVVPTLALAFGACNKKDEPAKPAAAVTQPAGDPSVPAAPVPPAPAAPAVPVAATDRATTPPATPVVAAPLTAEERAAKLGFARYLPADTESVISVHNGTKIGERAKSMKLWQVIEEQIGSMMGGMGPGMAPEEGFGRDMQPMEEDFAIPEEDEDEDAPTKKPAKEPADEPAKEPAKEGAAKPADDDALVGALLGAATGSTLVAADEPDADGAETKEVAEPPKGADTDAEGDAKPAAAAADEEMDEDEGDEDIPEDLIDPASPSAADLLGLEITFAVGKTAGAQLTNVLTLANRINYFQMRAIAKAFAASVKAGDFSEMQSAMETHMQEELLKDMVNDPESGLGLLERASMPPLYLAFRTTKDNQELVTNAIGQMIDSMGDAGEMAEPVTIEKAGATLTGYKLLGAKLVEEMGNDREEMEEMLGAETVEKLLAVIAKKNLVVTSGTLGDYVVLFVGTSEQDCNLVAEPANSLGGSPALAFTDAYAGKDLAALIYGNDSAAKALFEVQGAMASYTNGLRDGLSGAEGLEDTRDLEALLQMVAEREAALRKLGSTEALGMVAFFEEGLKVESFGGYDPGAIDWKTPSSLAHLGDSPDVAVFASVTSDAAYDVKNQAFIESIVETAYAITMKAAEMPMEDENMKEFKGMVTMFNDKFRTDALALWDALKGDLSNGLGKETALVMDLKGSMPTIPGVPQPVVDQAKFPRATLIMPVTDRAKLKSSWTKINAAATQLVAKISEMSGEDIPMQKPISSEKDGYTTWFMSLPFQSNDFIPSVTVGDKWFAASTSKDRALELLGQAATGAPGRTGFWMQVDFKAFKTCAVDTAKILDDNAEAVFGEGSMPLEQFKANKDLRDKLIDAMSDLDSLTVHSRREAGQLRGSVHFKTR